MLRTSQKRHRRSSSLLRKLRLEALETRDLLAAAVLQVQIENLSPDDGLALTPFWISLHDGNFDLGNPNEGAAADLELLAEEGDTSSLVTRFGSVGSGNDAVVLASDGFAGAPIFEPQETVTTNFQIDEAQIGRFFSYASMVIPSNDAFVANLDPQQFELFDANGDFLGPRSIVIYGDQVWDAGTEVNDPTGGAAFTTAGGSSATENGVIHPHDGLDDFVGSELPTGGTLQSAFTPQTPLARITLSLASDPSSPIDQTPPVATLQPGDVTDRTDFHEIRIVYTDPSGVDISSIDVNDIRVMSPSLIPLNVHSVSTDAESGTSPQTVTAAYRVNPTSGSFTAVDNGIYSVVLQPDEVNDPLDQSVTQQLLGTFSVTAPELLRVSIENLAETGGIHNTPVWLGVHNGSFETARAGVSLAGFAGTEALAEDGDASGLAARFLSTSQGSSTVITAPDGFAGAPVFEPGETVTGFLSVAAPRRDRFISYASMLIPSNDAFVANLDPRAHELFNAFGDFLGPRSITVYGADVWDAGTEVNDPAGGAAFAVVGGVGVDESGVVHRHLGLDGFVGADLPTDTSLMTAFGPITPLLRITFSLADAPSGPIDLAGPRATLQAEDVTAGGDEFHEIQVTYSDPSGIDVASIDVDDLQIAGAHGRSLNIIGVTTDAPPNSTPRSVTATYRAASLDGSFSTFDNSFYNVTLRDDAVNDTFDNATLAQTLGDFTILVGVRLQIAVENLSPEGGVASTPFWLGFHAGDFEVARAGRPAADFGGLEQIAEEGDPQELVDRFAADSDGVDAVLTAPDGFAGAPVFEPGEKASQSVEIFDTQIHRYFSFASMVIPSNDAFIANLNPTEYELFDVNGTFRGARSITLLGRDVWDAETEVNDPLGGAAFSTAGGTPTDENGQIRRHAGLADFIGTGLPTGENLEHAFAADAPLARITISLASDPASAIDQDGPIGSLDATAVTQAGVTSHQIHVMYHDPSGIDLTRFGTDDLRVTGPLGQQLEITDVVVEAPAGTTPNTVSVAYTLATEDDQFTARNNGHYLVELNPDSVGDTLAHGNLAQPLGTFQVDVAIRLQIEIESLAPDGGFAQTPFWVGFHNGNFEIARAGTAASDFAGLELIAEEGDPSGLNARFQATNGGISAVVTAPDGFAGAPVFEPGESATQMIAVADPNVNRYFSFASMIIPSNDAFVANLDPRQYELFDTNGNFRGARSFTIRGGEIWDAGTEVNNPNGGAAFSTEGGAPVDENGVVRRHAGLDDFLGTGLPTGENLTAALTPSPLVRITITMIDPEAHACSGVIGACSVRSVPLQNQRRALDVNDDGLVTSTDALLVINFLNTFGTRETIDDDARALGLFLDSGGDGAISSQDVLLVIDALNQRGSGNSNGGEGEFSGIPRSATPVAAVDRVFTEIPLEGLGMQDLFDFPLDDDDDDLFGGLSRHSGQG